MKNIYFIILLSLFFPQIDYNFSFESKFAKDSNASYKNPTFYENFLDVNMYIDDLYLFAQLEYSKPPLVGEDKTILKDALNIVYLEYFNDKFDITLGNLYILKGMGLSLHTFQDQNIDYDNSLYGFQSIYTINDQINFFTVAGQKEIMSRVGANEIVPSISIENRLFSIGTSGTYDKWNFHYLCMMYEQEYDYDDISSIGALPTMLGEYLSDMHGLYMANENPSFSMDNLEHNIGFTFFSDFIETTYERSLIYYTRLLSEREDGYREYMSTYFNFYDVSVILEHKDYNTPYFYSIFSNPPLVYRESTSALISRNIHSLNFNNEVGHQLEINKTFNNGLNVLFNYSFAMHYEENMENDMPSAVSLYGYMYNLLSDYEYMHKFAEFDPYRQIYFELSGWDKTEKFYYKLGYDHYQEYLIGKTILAKTYPMQFTCKLTQGSSMTIYFEMQDKWENDIEHYYLYFSPSYNHYGKWSLTFFYDYEQNVDKWLGADYTLNVNDLNQISIFYGSQKGGLVCANGSCVMQPDFDEGVKLTYRTSF